MNQSETSVNMEYNPDDDKAVVNIGITYLLIPKWQVKDLIDVLVNAEIVRYKYKSNDKGQTMFEEAETEDKTIYVFTSHEISRPEPAPMSDDEANDIIANAAEEPTND